MFGMGVTIEKKDLKRVLKKPEWVFLAVGLQFTVMPSIAYVITVFFNFDPQLALGFIILGSCPGGTASNVITYLCKGNVALSISCTIISTMAAVILTPLLIFFFSIRNIDINTIKIIETTFFIVFFPTVCGFFVKKFSKKYKIDLFIFPKISEIFIALIIGIILSINIENLNLLSPILIAGVIIHNLSGIIIGYLCCWLINYPEDVRKTVAIVVGMQNSGLGISLALLHFSKLAALPSALFSLWHNISAIGLVYFWKKK